ncbi:hypothetical protein EST62_00090 [Chlorobaculum sp. 24CR]|uniref:hypothetical protein n=1 Tax=Chlorobaculum sp. 24CR TaxID=2508878 RepID=UPI00100AF2B6|nr:hypothetical protein [Chlorobaculum sp. 24CR]RXK89428.1 hypothetical protein EST62_00090 [Chlorobaculum sp. 24CR]
MHTRKHTIGRNILRVFEIALFFVVSVLGYGLMLKTSSFSNKSKSRDHDSVAFEKTVDLNGRHRELRVLSGTLLFPNSAATTLSHRRAAASHACAAIHPLTTLARHLLSGNERHSHCLDGNRRLLRPCNLLEQNPVLLN